MSSNPNTQKPKMLAIVGPTASGKTSLAVAVAKKFDGEIVSADSRQIYRGMTIGTAKPPLAVRGTWLVHDNIPHHLIDVKNPDEDYSLGEYQHDAVAAIKDIVSRGKLPIVAGGTGLYVRAIVENLHIPKAAPDPALRKALEKEIETKGLAHVFAHLVVLDPEAAYVVDPKNPRRVVRALEVTIATGVPFTAQRRKHDPLFATLELGIAQPETVLRRRIDERIDEMMREGLVNEVKRLIGRYGEKPIAFEAIGYREIMDYLNGVSTEAEAVALMKTNTWHYARRQMTWFRKDKNIRWIRDERQANEAIRAFLET